MFILLRNNRVRNIKVSEIGVGNNIFISTGHIFGTGTISIGIGMFQDEELYQKFKSHCKIILKEIIAKNDDILSPDYIMQAIKYFDETNYVMGHQKVVLRNILFWLY